MGRKAERHTINTSRKPFIKVLFMSTAPFLSTKL
jgi:hypothetical protein